MWQYLLFDRIMVNNRSVKSFAGQITVNNISVDILMVDGSGMGGILKFGPERAWGVSSECHLENSRSIFPLASGAVQTALIFLMLIASGWESILT